MDRPTWDNWLMSLALVVSSRSTDESTKHGAILCDSKYRILGVGYNGFPRGSNDNQMPQDRPIKYDHIIHAEANCLLNSQNLLLGEDYTMYVTGFPCPGCFLLMCQAGVKNIVYGPVQSACVDKDRISLVKNLAASRNMLLRYYGGPFVIHLLAGKNLENNINPFDFDN